MRGPFIWVEEGDQRIAITQPAFAVLSTMQRDAQERLRRQICDISRLVKLTPARWRRGGENLFSVRVSDRAVRYRVSEETLAVIVEEIETRQAAPGL